MSSRNVLEIQEVYFALCEKFNSLRSHYEETITMMEMKYCYYGTNIFMINGKLALIIQYDLIKFLPFFIALPIYLVQFHIVFDLEKQIFVYEVRSSCFLQWKNNK